MLSSLLSGSPSMKQSFLKVELKYNIYDGDFHWQIWGRGNPGSLSTAVFFHIRHTLSPHVLCFVYSLVTCPWAGPSSLIEFHLTDKHMCEIFKFKLKHYKTLEVKQSAPDYFPGQLLLSNVWRSTRGFHFV